MKRRCINSRGQLTIFIILAILIIALALLTYFLYPKLKGGGLQTDNPYAYIQKCMTDTIEETVETISLNGGSYDVDEKTGGFFYRGDYIRYLCYTGEDLKPCVNQELFLTQHIESEIIKFITPEVENCLDSLEATYDKKGYNVDLKRGEAEVKILPEMISTKLNSELSLIKGGDTQTYKEFEIILDSHLYDIIEVVKNTIIWEMNVGDSIPEAYMINNPYIKVEKRRKENDVKLYTITDRNTEEVFRFAVRSIAYPVGFPNI